MTKGSIVLVPFPFTDLTGSKVRPALVLAIPRGSVNTIVAFISSRKSAAKIEGDFHLSPESPHFRETGLKMASVVRLSTIASLDRQVVLGKIGSLAAPAQKKIDATLARLFRIG